MNVGDKVVVINNNNNESDEHIIKQMDRLIGRKGRVVDMYNNLVDVEFYSRKYHMFRTYCFKTENLEVIEYMK